MRTVVRMVVRMAVRMVVRMAVKNFVKQITVVFALALERYAFFFSDRRFSCLLATLSVTLSDVILMFDEIPNIFVCHVWNDRTGANEKNLTTPHDRTHRIVLESYDRNSRNTGFQACRRH